MGGPSALNPNFNPAPQSYSRGIDDRPGRVSSPAANQRGGMRSDTISAAAPIRSAISSSSSGDVKATLRLSSDASAGPMRAFPPSPDKVSRPSLSPVSTRSPPFPIEASTPANLLSTVVNGVSAHPEFLAPLPPSLFFPPTSPKDLAAKLKLAEMKLAELIAQAKLADGHLDLVKRAAKRKEGEQERELAVLRRELEVAKRTAVEMQMKAGVTQRYVRRFIGSREERERVEDGTVDASSLSFLFHSHALSSAG